MSDNDSSSAPSNPTPAGDTPPTGAFGSTRGSGLLRGKRPTTPAASAPSSAGSVGYKPTALEVIIPQREYKNPFTGETTVSAPARPEQVERVVNEPAPQAAPSAPAPAPVAEAPAPISPKPSEAAPTADLFPFTPPASSASAQPAAPEEKPELKILPPQEAKRPAMNWESSKAGDAGQPPRRDERASFRPERREDRKFEPREAKPFEPREPRRDERKFEPRTNQPYQPREERAPRAEQPAPEKKSGGFLGWLKGLFGGSKPTTPAQPERREGGGRDGEYGQRRHRGGRGRGRGGFQGDNRGGQPFQHRDPRDEQPGESRQGGDYQQGESRSDGQYGGGRRRRRGGRGRFRGEGGEGGDRGGRDPRPEGQQGGGAI